MDLEKLAAVGTPLGLSGPVLMEWIANKRAEKRADREAEREARKEAALREKEAAEREKEAAEIKTEADEREMTLLQLRIRAQESAQSCTVVTGESVAGPSALVSNPQKLLLLFDERRDDLHAYLQRFERVAVGQG